MAKVSSISLDTNVILDLPLVPRILENRPVTEAERKLKSRVLDSYQIANLCLSDNVKVTKVGLKIVEKELHASPELIPLFRLIFPSVLKPNWQAKKLAEKYVSEVSLEYADALVVATASINSVTVLLTWNRTDLANDSTRVKINRINASQKVPGPLICDPSYFIDRLIGSTGKHEIVLALSPNPVPQVYRLKFFPSR